MTEQHQQQPLPRSHPPAHSGSSTALLPDTGTASSSSSNIMADVTYDHRFLHSALPRASPSSPASSSPVRRVGVKRRLTFDISSSGTGSSGSSASFSSSHHGDGILSSLRTPPQQLQQLALASRVLPVLAPFTASRPLMSHSALRVATQSRSPGPSFLLRQLDFATLQSLQTADAAFLPSSSPVLSSSPPSFIASLSPSMSPPLPALPRHSLLPAVSASPVPLSPHLLPVPDFSLHDVNVRQSPMRLSSALPVCPQTPTRSKRKREGEDELLTTALTLFHAGSRRRDRSAEEEEQREEEAQAAAYHSSDSNLSDDDRADAASLTSHQSSPLAASFAPFSLSSLSALLLSSSPPSPPAAASSSCPFPEPTRCSDFVFEEKIGQGSFSEVWRVRRRARAGGAEGGAGEDATADDLAPGSGEEGRRYAISRSLKPVRSSQQHERFLRHGAQLSLLFSSSPPHVLRHHCVWLEQSCVFKLTDFHPLGDLVSFFQRPREESCLWRLLLHVGQALSSIANMRLLHFDVKPSNILVSAATQPASGSHPSADCAFDFWLADLGTMIALSDWGSGRDDADEGDGQYLAPEVLTAASLTSGVDVYALGCTVYACITGRVLQRGGGGDGLSFDDELHQTCGVQGAVSAELRGVLMAMTEAQLDRRMGLDELISRAARQLQADAALEAG